MPAKRQRAASIQIRLPIRSDSAPIKGLATMPVQVETATIIPTSISPAPIAAANSGSTGVFPN